MNSIIKHGSAILFMIIWGSFIIVKGQNVNNQILLYDLKFNPDNLDNCGDARLGSTLYIMLKGDVIGIDSSGLIICNLSYEPNDFSKNFRICIVKLAGIAFNKDLNKTLNKLNNLLYGKKIIVLSAQSKCTTHSFFEGLIEFENHSINYSLLKNKLASYRYEAYALDFWTACKFEQVDRINKK